MTLAELNATAKAMRKRAHDLFRVILGTVGVQLPDPEEESEVTFEDIRKRSMGYDTETNDIATLKGQLAREVGFGVGFGLEYEQA